MNNKKIYTTVGTVYTPNTQIHDRSPSCLGIDTSIKFGGVKLYLC